MLPLRILIFVVGIFSLSKFSTWTAVAKTDLVTSILAQRTFPAWNISGV